MANRAALFALVAVAQLAVPGWMMFQHERVLREGQVFKFKTAPIDPKDPFRGDYVVLSFEAQRGEWTIDSTMEENAEERWFATLSTDSAGFAVISALSEERPKGVPYLPVTFWHWQSVVNDVTLPFDRYFLEEGDGRRTEDLMAGRTDLVPWSDPPPTDPLPAFALVRVLNGQAVIEDLIVGGRSIHDWLNDQAPSSTGEQDMNTP